MAQTGALTTYCHLFGRHQSEGLRCDPLQLFLHQSRQNQILKSPWAETQRHMTTSPQIKSFPVLINFAASKIPCLCLVLFFVPASVPISLNTSGPQVLTGPKASGLDKQLASASICCSVQGSEVSRRNGIVMLQFQGEQKCKRSQSFICAE